MKKIIFIILAICLLPSVCTGQSFTGNQSSNNSSKKTAVPIFSTIHQNNWHEVVKKPNASFFLLPESIAVKNQYVYFLEKGIYNKTITGSKYPFNEPFKSYIARRRINCSDQSVSNVAIKTFKDDGNTSFGNTVYNVYIDEKDITDNIIKRGSTEELLYDQVCTRREASEYESNKYTEKICSKYSIDDAIRTWKAERPYAHIIEEHYNDPEGKDPQKLETNCRYMEYYLDFSNVR